MLDLQDQDHRSDECEVVSNRLNNSEKHPYLFHHHLHSCWTLGPWQF